MRQPSLVLTLTAAGSGFVEMASKEAGEAAIVQFNGKEVNGRNLNVNEAKPRENRSFGANRNGSNRSFGADAGRQPRSDFGGDRPPRW